MAEPSLEQRRLATILSLDVAGYSRAAEQDDAAAAASVRQLRAVIEEIVAPFGGRIFSSAGDGFMLEFPAAASGVQAAMALLRESRSGARPLPQIRIGLHLGDVIVEPNGDLLGHGVNVAARLQALAETGSAVVSETVRQQVRSIADLPFTSEGRVQLDKMHERINVYSLSPGKRTSRLGKIMRRRISRVGLAIGALLAVGLIAYGAWNTWGPKPPPRVAVLRLINIGSATPGLANEVADELISELSRIQGLEVTARSSSFALTGTQATPEGAAAKLGASLVLSGSVRLTDENQLRVQAQLFEAPSGRQVWAEAFERPIAEVFQLERDIAVRVVHTVSAQVESEPAQRVDPEAYQLFLQGMALLEGNRHSDARAARDLFRAAVDRDPSFSRAWAALAYMENDLAQAAIMNGPPDMQVTDALFQPALDAADHAIALDRHSARAIGLKGVIYNYLGEWRQAAAMTAQSERMSGHPDFTVNIQLGYIDKAVAAARHSTQLDPLNPRSWTYLEMACRMQGDTACQLEGARRAHELAPTEPVPLGYLFYALAESGDLEDARQLHSKNEAMLASFYEINSPVDTHYFSWMTGNGPKPSAAEIVRRVRARQAYVDPAVEMLDHMHEWGAAASIMDKWGAAARPSLWYLYRPVEAPLRRTPQFWALMEREGLTSYWRASGHWPDFCAREHVCPQ